jgi:predicted amidohydrolase YtcJ
MAFILFWNARFHSLEKNKIFDWLLAANGKIISLGYLNDLPPSIPGIKKIDLCSKTVIPAFTDAHTHFVLTALGKKRIELNNAGSLSDALQILNQAKMKSIPGSWIYGQGYDRNLWQDGRPHKKYLDKIFSDQPVVLESKDCHAVWANSAALKKAGIDKNTNDPKGGKIERDANGEPNGIIYEEAQKLIRKNAPALSLGEMMHAVEENLANFHALGVTSVHTMEGIDEFKALQILAGQDKLKVRATIYLPHENLEQIILSGIYSGFGNKWLRVGGIKYFADGSLGSQTAEMIEPYEGSQNYGVENLSAEELKDRIILAAKNRLAAAVHAIGDRALTKTLDAFENAESPIQKYKLINRIEHAQLVPLDELSRFKTSGIIASVQPIHLADDVKIADLYWGKRAAGAYPFRSLIDHNITLAFGSDTPVASFDPIKGIYTAVHRRYNLDENGSSWYPEQCITVKDAVRAYTIGPALAEGALGYKGTLAPGKLADFLVLNKDIFEIPAEEILQVKVIKTILGGDIIFEE